MFKVNSKNTRTRCEICSKLIIKTPEWRQWCLSGVFIVNFEYILHLVFLLLTWSRQLPSYRTKLCLTLVTKFEVKRIRSNEKFRVRKYIGQILSVISKGWSCKFFLSLKQLENIPHAHQISKYWIPLRKAWQKHFFSLVIFNHFVNPCSIKSINYHLSFFAKVRAQITI